MPNIIINIPLYYYKYIYMPYFFLLIRRTCIYPPIDRRGRRLWSLVIVELNSNSDATFTSHVSRRQLRGASLFGNRNAC